MTKTEDTTSGGPLALRSSAGFGFTVGQGVRPLGEPLFLLHTGALYGNERDSWDVEANSQNAVDQLVEAQPLGAVLHLFALTPEEVATVNKHRALKVWRTRQTHLCRCDHNEYCQHCWPESFRPGGVWHGLGA